MSKRHNILPTRTIFFISSAGRTESVQRGGSRTAATSKMEHFVRIVNGFQPLTIITKCSILDVAAVPDPPLVQEFKIKLFEQLFYLR